MAKIFLLTGVVLTFAIGTVAATETGMLMPISASLVGGHN